MPKEEKFKKAITVELFSNSTFCCPLDALKKWKLVSKVAGGRLSPLFREESGVCYTGAEFNADLKRLLGKVIDYDKKKVLSHSFRAGMASMMARVGMSDFQIQVLPSYII